MPGVDDGHHEDSGSADRSRNWRHRQTGIVFVRLPGGTFLMGAQKTDPNGPNYVLLKSVNKGESK